MLQRQRSTSTSLTMMIQNEDNDIDLGLSLANSNETKLKSERGAGVNAGSRMDMAFAASDPLSELVWSPHKGLSLKCADSTLSHKKPLLLWNVGPTTQLLSPPQSIRSAGPAVSLQTKTYPAYGHHIGSTSKEEMNKAEEVNEVRGNQNDTKHSDEEANNLENNFIRNADASNGYNSGPGDEKTLNFLPRGSIDSKVGSAFCKPHLSSKLDGKISISCSGRIEHAASGSRILGLGIAEALPIRQEAEKEVELANEQKSENKMSMPCLISGAPLEKLESSAENDLLHLIQIAQNGEQLAKENPIAVEASPTNSRMHLYRRKGKGKALSNRNVAESASNDEEDSRESVESSNSGGLFAKRRKRLNLEESIVGTKRAKKETNDHSPDTTSTIRHDSSFMNWISNMVKGYSRVNQEHNPSWRETDQQLDISASNRNMGFRTMFQSLYCPEIRVSKGEYSRVEESKELVLVNKSAVQIPRIGCRTDMDKPNFISKQNIRHASTSGNQVGLSSQLRIMPVNAAPLQEEVSEGNEASSDQQHGNHLPIHRVNLTDSFPNQRNNSTPENKSPEGTSNVGSLWITRFSTKNSSTSLKLDHGNQNEYKGVKDITLGFPIGHEPSDIRDDSNEHDYDMKSVHKLNSPKYSKSSDAMASVFAKRLDALKHISPSDIMENDTICRTRTCLFCGRHGHDLRYCSDTTDSDLAALLRNVSSYEGSSSCLCLLCFQLDHWANTCPLRSSRRRHKLKEKIAPSVKENPAGNVILYSNEVNKCIDSNSVEYSLKKRQDILPICNFVGKQMSSDVPKDMFDAIRKLRLSRIEILKWMNSNVSPDGFFLRVRLGKREAVQGGPGYHVACITTGGENENSAKDSKKSISVNMGGIQCLVGIQYISNHDFLEDELVAWWCRTLRNGAKVPRKQDLKSKFQERIKFGL